ncbi:acidic leucine-rich nuclear phosphoprotein 32 family member E-like isoform X2 [Crocuta crocuta]
MEMKKRINLELRNRAPEGVTEFVLDNCLCVNGEIEGLNDTFTKLEFLSVANVELSSLARRPSLTKLRELEITLQNLQNLKSLDLFNGEIANLEDYGESIFELLQQVTYLDRLDQEDNEAPDSEEDDDEDGDEDDEDEEEHEAGPPEGYEEEEEEEEEDEAGSELGEEEEVGLSYLMKEEIQDEEEDDDYVEEGEEEEEDEEEGLRGEKGKRGAEDDGDKDDD